MIKKTSLYKFFEQVRQEARKVIWPQKKELVTSVGVVIIAVIICSLICLTFDYSIHKIISLLLSI